jgi:hypothetical protein
MLVLIVGAETNPLESKCSLWHGKSAPALPCTASLGHHAALSSHEGLEPAYTRTQFDAQNLPPPSVFHASFESH